MAEEDAEVLEISKETQLPPVQQDLLNEGNCEIRDKFLEGNIWKVGDDLEIRENRLTKAFVSNFSKIGALYQKNSAIFATFTNVVIVFFYIGYMIAALAIDFDRALPLLIIFCVVVLYKIYTFLRVHYGNTLWEALKPAHQAIGRNVGFLKWYVYDYDLVGIAVALIVMAVFIALDISRRPRQFISMAGYILFLFLLWILGSKCPEKVRWRPVIWGLTIQILLTALILRVESVFRFFNWLGLFTQNFLDYVVDGSKLLFGDLYYHHILAFKVLPIVIYFSSFISVMYYLGVMQWLIYKIAWVMQFTLGTSGTESMCAAGNIFIGIAESPLLILPYFKDVTTSEMFAIMTAGFGTIAGSILGAYLGLGIKAVYVITACVMAAPCALALAKLMYPETKVSKFRSLKGLAIDSSDQGSIIEAAFVGASTAVPLVVNIAANLIAFISLLAALNGFLSWYGGLIGYPKLGFGMICSYIFVPITYLMGIDWEDCFKCAELLGIKIFLNELIAYQELSELIKVKNNGTFEKFSDDGSINWINDRSEAIITYALCGFANLGSIGIMLGTMGSICPERRKEIADIVVRAMIAGVFVSVLNACAAGFFYKPNPNCEQIYKFITWNGTVELGSLHSCCEDAVYIEGSLNASRLEYLRCCNFDWENTNYDHFNCSS